MSVNYRPRKKKRPYEVVMKIDCVEQWHGSFANRELAEAHYHKIREARDIKRQVKTRRRFLPEDKFSPAAADCLGRAWA